MSIKFSRYRCMPNKWTFLIPPVAQLLKYYNVGKGWVDPFAGANSPAEFTNDLNPAMPTLYHYEAVEFCALMEGPFEGVLFDPPYSYRQVSEHYKMAGRRATQLDTSSNFYNRTKNAICDKIKEGGYAISFGWNSNGFGGNRNFEPIEIMLLVHGEHHNDTLVTVEQKINPGICGA